MRKPRIADLPPILIGGGQLPAPVAWRLLDALFGQATSLFFGALSMAAMGLLWWARTRSPWPLAWTVALVAVALGRHLLAQEYRKNAHVGEPWIRTRRFMLGSYGTAALWGIAGFVVILEPDLFAQFLVITVQSGYLAAAAARNNASPASAIGQLLLGRIPLIIACLATGNVYYAAFTIFVALHMVSATAIIRYLSSQNLKLLLADRGKAELIAQVNAVNAELQSANSRLEALAAIDGLTGLMNRRVFDIALSREWYRGLRQQEPLSLLIVDLDCFKQFNDCYGHVAGDDCLKMVAEATAAAARRMTDLVGRYGGEELVVLLPNTEAAGAATLSERTRREVEVLGIPHASNPWKHVTVSIGVATIIPTPESSTDDLVRLADTELYRAKADGRNRVSARGASANPLPKGMGSSLPLPMDEG